MNFFKSILLLSSAYLFLMVGFSSCNVNNSSSPKGKIHVNMTDAPVSYDAVYIDVQSIQLRYDDTDDETDGWITMDYSEDPINMLTLRNGNEITLGKTELEAGHYSQIRLVLGNDNQVVINGNTHDLTTPSAQQSGLKLNINAEITGGDTYTLLVDFDASRSIVTTGSGKYILKPVLHVVDVTKTGAISGEVEPADFQTSVMAVMNEDTLSTLTDDNGAFVIQGAVAGSYNVIFVPGNDQYADSTQTNISVSTGENTNLGTISLQKQP